MKKNYINEFIQNKDFSKRLEILYKQKQIGEIDYEKIDEILIKEAEENYLKNKHLYKDTTKKEYINNTLIAFWKCMIYYKGY